MKKQTILGSLLVLFPVLAVGLATTVNSVTVFNTVAGTSEFYSYFDPIPVASLQFLTPLAATLCPISGIFAAVYLGKKKAFCLKAAGYTAIAAAVAACIPITIRGDILVIPNVGLPVFMMLQYVVASYIAKHPAEMAADKKAPRLKKR